MDTFFHIQGDPTSSLAPLILIHAVSGFAIPYLSLGPLSSSTEPQHARPVYGLSCPFYEYQSYHLPASFEAVAREYIHRIRKEIPYGPYVLGGWSMGGMIAVKVAEIFESEGEEVVRIILIDSANPEGYPAFGDTHERDQVAVWTYKAYAERSGLPTLVEVDREGGRQCSKIDDKDSGFEDENGAEVDVMEYLPRMRKHIYNSLDMIARAGQGGYLPKLLQSPVTLLKCTRHATLPEEMSEERMKAIRRRFEDERAGWPMERFESIPLNAQHDHVFDREHVGQVTDILKRVLEETR